ncbi:HAD-like domain-containing protein [Boeremia exigua]|uniref:HAD-like domain-containing protein n=1 Tax=Boeremia exigua TaxID=749465 RepID=UPI001E8CA9EF|nr:HAD-like domain-containing protein [Boeremia exigua]KAH6642647.1 HAD-like domain-containing protein [Boeremia exigua]
MSVDIKRYISHDTAVAEPNTNPLKAAAGHHHSAFSLHTRSQPPAAAMNNNFNPWAQPFTPNYGYPGQPYDQNRNRSQQTPAQGYMPPASVANAQWSARYGQPQHYYPNSPQPYNAAAAQQQVQAQAYYYQWAQYYGYSQGFTPINPPQQALGQTPQRNYPFFAPSFAALQSQPDLQGLSNDDIQASTPLSDDDSSQIVKDGLTKAKEVSKAIPTTKPTGRSREAKIMLPAPTPGAAYMAQAAEEPSTVEVSGRILVILDLNGTLLYRPTKNKRTMIARPFLIPFLRYLFSNFAVMVWSSARPENVASLVEQSLEENLRKTLVAQWARDNFNLKPEFYNRNVQVYKNLNLVWGKDEIQRQHPDYQTGGRFGQHNTVLIDDSMLKAAAQPHNLLQISEFTATSEQMREDKLLEVAGYLEGLRSQQDVSKFMRKEPFQHDSGKWAYEWPEADALTQGTTYKGGELQDKVSMQSPSKKKKKNKKAKKREAAEQAGHADGNGQAAQYVDSGSEEEVGQSDGGVKLF